MHAGRLLAKLNYLISYPKSVDMPNLLIVGQSGNGKTSLIHELMRQYPRDDNINGDSATIPIVYCEAPPSPDLGGFYNEILDSIGLPPHRGRVEARRYNVQSVLNLVGVKLLVIDEIQHGLQAGPQSQRIFLSAIKSLGNHLQIPIVALGTREALSLFNKDEQIRRRFALDELPGWKLDNDFRRLLLSFERLLPLRRPSNLASPELARLLHGLSMGTIGRVAKILAAAATAAIESGEEQITAAILNSVDLDILASDKLAK